MSPQRPVVDSATARDWAVTACCIAAAAVGDSMLANRTKASRLMDCLGVLNAAQPLETDLTLSDFRARLRGPLRDLLPPGVDVDPVGDLVLLDSLGRLSDEAEDVCREHFVPTAAPERHWPWQLVRAEQEEQCLYKELRKLGSAGYARARTLLVDHASGEASELRRAWDELWPRVGEYQPITTWPWTHIEKWWFPCPQCRWPMRVGEDQGVWSVRCEAHVARGVRYTTRPEDWPRGQARLRSSGRNAPPVTGRAVTPDHLAVSRAVWRFVTLPGVLECELRDHAQDCGASVTMYPELDAYDLHIAAGAKVWRIDAKAWACPSRLVDAFATADKPTHGLTVVIPDHQLPTVEALDRALRQYGARVRTARQVKKEITQVVKEAR